MALGAMANDPNLRVRIVPVGLSYFHAHRFRSRAVVEFGSALDVPPEFVEMFKQGGQQKREAVSSFLNLIYDSLKTVTIRAPDYDTLMVSARTGLRVAVHSNCSLNTAYSSRPTSVQDSGTAFDIRSSCRTESEIARRLCALQRRT